MSEEKKRRGRPPGSKNKPKKAADPAKIAAGSRLKDEIWSIVIIALGAFLVFPSRRRRPASWVCYIEAVIGLLRICRLRAALLSDPLRAFAFCEKTAHISGRSVFFCSHFSYGHSAQFDQIPGRRLGIQPVAPVFKRGIPPRNGTQSAASSA